MEELLQAYYQRIAVVHGLTGFFAKITLGAIVAAVAMGNRRPGYQLLNTVLGIQFLIVGYLAIAQIAPASGDAGFGAAVVPIGVLGVGLAIVFGLAVLKPEGQWLTARQPSWRQVIGWALIAWGFYYPIFSRGWIGPVFFSPTGALPQPLLLIACSLAWLSMPDTNRLVSWAAGVAALVVGAIDVFAAGVQSSWLLILLAGLLGWELLGSTIRSGGIFEEDVPQTDKAQKEKKKEEIRQKSAPGREWKLK